MEVKSGFALPQDFAWKVENDCAEFMKTKGILQGVKLPHFPWVSSLSDHLPRTAVLQGKRATIRIMTWNTNNPAYGKWLKRRADTDTGEDLSQRIEWILGPDSNDPNTRLLEIASVIYQRVEEGYVVCLQEVGEYLHTKIQELANNSNNKDLTYVVSNFEKEDNNEFNENLTIFDIKFYELLEHTDVNAPDLGIPDNKLVVLKLRPKQDNKEILTFNLVNVHVSWKKNKAYAALLTELFVDPKKNTLGIVCGDFNCSSRYPDRKNGVDHLMDCYNDTDFRIAMNPEHDRREYTHINTIQNAKTTFDQLDCFDYIMLINRLDNLF